LRASWILVQGRPDHTARTKEEEMKGSTLISAGGVRRIVLTAVAAAALIVPATAQAVDSTQQFSLPPGATAPPVFSPPPGATLPSRSPDSVSTDGLISRPAPADALAARNRAAEPVVTPASHDGFDLGDAGIGAAVAAGGGAILLAGAALLTGRRRRLGAFHS
jgi:hypothetical protein